MFTQNVYKDLRGNTFDVSSLDREERELVAELLQFAEKNPDARTTKYWNFYIRRLGEFYEKRGLARHETTRTLVWRIAQDINGRLMIASGTARRGDYRDDLEWLIFKHFSTRRAFCEATGLTEDMLSHVLAKRKDFGIQTLADALAKIGYTIHITPLSESTRFAAPVEIN
ncbi:MAG: hypothetical protein WD468_09895 [Pirellulales bacterium]